MLKQRQAKGPKSADFLERQPLPGRRVGNTPLHLYLTILLLTWCLMPAYADAVYRCGEAYSTVAQCGSTAATEVKPTSALATGASTNTSANDVRDAQALEKQRLQGQRQAAQTVPVQINAPLVQTPVATSHESAAHSGKRQHTHRPASPYFTAVDPHAKQKKKSTAKTVPANTASNP